MIQINDIISRRPILAALLVAGVLCDSQSLAQILTNPALGHSGMVAQQVIRGKDHPELFSRKIALEMILNLLAIDPRDALKSQHRARVIEAKRIGLSTSDTAALEEIVETYRLKRDSLDLRVSGLVAIGKQSDVSALASLNVARKALVRETLHQIGQQISGDGKKRISMFADEVISKSELHQSGSGGKNEATH